MKATILIVGIACLGATLLQGNPQRRLDLRGSVGGGLLAGGEFEASWESDFPADRTMSMATDPSWLLRGSLDAAINSSVALGLLAIYAPITPREDIEYLDGGSSIQISRHDLRLFDIGLGPVVTLPLDSKVLVRCALYGGFRWSYSSVSAGREFGMAIDGTIAAEYAIDEQLRCFLETGFIGQPYGGVQDLAFIRGGPILYVAAGLSFNP